MRQRGAFPLDLPAVLWCKLQPRLHKFKGNESLLLTVFYRHEHLCDSSKLRLRWWKILLTAVQAGDRIFSGRIQKKDTAVTARILWWSINDRPLNWISCSPPANLILADRPHLAAWFSAPRRAWWVTHTNSTAYHFLWQWGVNFAVLPYIKYWWPCSGGHDKIMIIFVIIHDDFPFYP